MSDHIEITRAIAASPDAIYDAIADITRMGEWSPECHNCEWTGDSHAPVVGATFDGHNRHGEHTWTSQCAITEADRGRAFTFTCSMFDFHYATWGYRIEATDGGCRVTEWSDDLRPTSTLEFSKQMSGVDDRHARNEVTISGTLERLAAAVEA